ncbi:hypothetical protein ACVBGC_24110 [Burkholderia stagnalis]
MRHSWWRYIGKTDDIKLDSYGMADQNGSHEFNAANGEPHETDESGE